MTHRTRQMLRAWTIQPWAVWCQLRTSGIVSVDWRYAAGIHYSYDWLREELTKRLPSFTGNYPWWAYDSRPDLRRFRHEKPLRHDFALLELSIPQDLVVTLYASAWNQIFYGEPITNSDREKREWNQRLSVAIGDEVPWPLPEPWRSKLHKNWERVFVEKGKFATAESTRPNRSLKTHSVELVFEYLRLENVVSVTKFVGSKRADHPRDINPLAFISDGPTMMHRQA